MSTQQIESIYGSALEVLETIGVKVFDPEALKLMEKAGGSVDADGLVRLRPHLIEQAISSTPKRLLIYDRLGNPAMVLGGKNTGGLNTYYGTGSDLRYTYDPITSELRMTVTQDIADMAKTVDALPNMDFIMSYGIPSDASLEHTFEVEFLQMVSNSTKPIVFTSDDGPNSRCIIDMAAVVAGGLDKLREKPFVLNYAQPTSPLCHSEDAMGKLLTCAELGIPVCYPPGVMPGATAPVTLAGALIQSLAEALSALVIHQTKNPGAPIALSGAHGCLDMQTTVNVYAAPERLMTQAALAAIYQYFGIPTWGLCGHSDALILDEQAGAEYGLTVEWATLMGVNLAHDVGYLGSGMIGDLRAIVFNDEIISYVKHMIVRGIPVNEQTRAIDVIRQVGPGGNFLAEEHTFKYFRSHLWRPSLSNRLNLDNWINQGKKTMKDRLSDRVKEILKDHTPQPLERTTVCALDEMLGVSI